MTSQERERPDHTPVVGPVQPPPTSGGGSVRRRFKRLRTVGLSTDARVSRQRVAPSDPAPDRPVTRGASGAGWMGRTPRVPSREKAMPVANQEAQTRRVTLPECWHPQDTWPPRAPSAPSTAAYGIALARALSRGATVTGPMEHRQHASRVKGSDVRRCAWSTMLPHKGLIALPAARPHSTTRIRWIWTRGCLARGPGAFVG